MAAAAAASAAAAGRRRRSSSRQQAAGRVEAIVIAAAVVAPAAKTNSSSRSCSINTVAAVAVKVAGGDATPGGPGEGLFNLPPDPEMIPRAMVATDHPPPSRWCPVFELCVSVDILHLCRPKLLNRSYRSHGDLTAIDFPECISPTGRALYLAKPQPRKRAWRKTAGKEDPVQLDSSPTL